jgi:osmotically-inducible protein OsmY
MFEGTVPAQVRAGWVPLNGEVEWDYQRREVKRMVRNVRGVVGISSTIAVTAAASAPGVASVESHRHQSRHPRPLVRQAAAGRRPERIRAALRR